MNSGFWITRILRPEISAALLIGRRLLVSCRKPFSQNPSPTRFFSGSFASSFSPNGPSRSASASRSLLNVSGKFSTPNSLTRLTSVELSGTVISCVPPRSAEIIVASLTSAPPANSLMVSAPLVFCDRISQKRLTAIPCGWSSFSPMPTFRLSYLTWAQTTPADWAAARNTPPHTTCRSFMRGPPSLVADFGRELRCLFLLARLLALGVELLHQRFADLRGVLVDDRLHLVAHARHLLRRDVVDLHPALDQELARLVA